MGAIEEINRGHGLATLVRYYCLTHNKAWKEVASELQLDEKKLSNFLTNGRGPYDEEIKKRFAHIFKEEAYPKGKPIHILAAIAEVYGLRSTDSMDGVFLQIAQTDADQIKMVSNCYSGVFHMFRYAAHVNEKAKKLTDRTATENATWDAMVVRTALYVKPSREDGRDFPKFEIAYKPKEPQKSEQPKMTLGSLVPLFGGPYLGFFGVEQDTRYPLHIRAHRTMTPPSYFKGMVERHMIDSGQVVAGRLAFVRATSESPGAPAITTDPVELQRQWEDAKSKVGVFRESELIKDCKDEFSDLPGILRDVENIVKYDGKSGLWL